MGFASLIIVLLAFFLLFLASRSFRGASDELFGHYCLNFLRYAWPYFLIYVAYNLIENRDLFGDVDRIASRWPYLLQIVIAGLGIYLILMIVSPRFRAAGNEFWGHYVVNSLRLGWPYVLIIAVYIVVRDGSASAFVKRIVAGG